MHPDKLTEEVAKIIFENEDGSSPEEKSSAEYKAAVGIEPQLWEIPGVIQNYQLAEWQRDDYRFQAKQVLDYLAKKGFLKNL